MDLLEILNLYRSGIAKNLSELGCTHLIEMDIQIKPGCTPPFRKPIPASDEERSRMKDIIREYRSLGLIQDTDAEYASSLFLVYKKSGEPRIVADYRPINKQIVRINFPLSSIYDQLSKIGECILFIVLDFDLGYMQIPLSLSAREKTAFITPDETGQFTRMMFGLTNASFYFSKLMYCVLGPLRDHNNLFYLDDILLLGKSWTDLREKLIMVMRALVAAGLTINLKKCQFLKSSVTYLGFVISAEGIKPGTDKLRAIAVFPVPTYIHKVRQFHGLCSFFRRFVPKFAVIASPLYDLLNLNNRFKWTDPEEKAFRDLIDKLTSGPILQPFCSDRKTELHTDASALGFGAMMCNVPRTAKYFLFKLLDDGQANQNEIIIRVKSSSV